MHSRRQHASPSGRVEEDISDASLFAAADALLDALAAGSEAAEGPRLRAVGDALLDLLMLRRKGGGSRRGSGGPPPEGDDSAEGSPACVRGSPGPSGPLVQENLDLARHILARLLTLMDPARGEEGEGDSPCEATASPALHALRRSCAALLYEAADVLDLRGPLVEAGCVGTMARLLQIGDYSGDTIHTAGTSSSSLEGKGGEGRARAT